MSLALSILLNVLQDSLFSLTMISQTLPPQVVSDISHLFIYLYKIFEMHSNPAATSSREVLFLLAGSASLVNCQVGHVHIIPQHRAVRLAQVPQWHARCQYPSVILHIQVIIFLWIICVFALKVETVVLYGIMWQYECVYWLGRIRKVDGYKVKFRCVLDQWAYCSGFGKRSWYLYCE